MSVAVNWMEVKEDAFTQESKVRPPPAYPVAPTVRFSLRFWAVVSTVAVAADGDAPE